MENLALYNQAFCEAFDLSSDAVDESLAYKSIPAWDSVGQMMLVAALENAFGIELAPDDIIGINSYKTGKEILQNNYGIQF